MKVGLIARAEDRGLGYLTWDFYRAMQPARTLVVDMGLLAGQHFPMHRERYPDASLVPFDGRRFGFDLRPWLKGLDVVYTAETFYDPDLVTVCEEMGVATVCHVMPEFFKWTTEPQMPVPTAWWAPTAWRREAMPGSVRYVPVPVPLDASLFGASSEGRKGEEPLFVHVAGHRAMRDRNGTIAMFRALRFLREKCSVRVISQDPSLPGEGGWAPYVNVERRTGGVADRWDLYRGADALVQPRRFGGLCLPVQEAMGCGLTVLMSDCPPNNVEWPVSLIPAMERGYVETGGGRVATYDCDPRAIASAMDWVSRRSPAEWEAGRQRSLDWAAAHSWDKLRGLYEVELELACSSRQT